MLLEFRCPEHGVWEELCKDRPKFRRCPECNIPCKPLWPTFRTVVTFRSGWQPAFGRNFDTKRELDNAVAEKDWIRDR